MKKLLRCRIGSLILFILSFSAVTFLVAPVMAEEMAAEFAEVARIEKSIITAYEMVVKAEETGDTKLIQEALKLLKESADRLSEIAPIAKDEGVVKLCQKVLNAAKRIEIVLFRIVSLAQNIIQTSTDASVVAAAEEVLAKSGYLKDENEITINIALACGAVRGRAEAFEPPEGTDFGPTEPNIENQEPGSTT